MPASRLTSLKSAKQDQNIGKSSGSGSGSKGGRRKKKDEINWGEELKKGRLFCISFRGKEAAASQHRSKNMHRMGSPKRLVQKRGNARWSIGADRDDLVLDMSAGGGGSIHPRPNIVRAGRASTRFQPLPARRRGHGGFSMHSISGKANRHASSIHAAKNAAAASHLRGTSKESKSAATKQGSPFEPISSSYGRLVGSPVITSKKRSSPAHSKSGTSKRTPFPAILSSEEGSPPREAVPRKRHIHSSSSPLRQESGKVAKSNADHKQKPNIPSVPVGVIKTATKAVSIAVEKFSDDIEIDLTSAKTEVELKQNKLREAETKSLVLRERLSALRQERQNLQEKTSALRREIERIDMQVVLEKGKRETIQKNINVAEENRTSIESQVEAVVPEIEASRAHIKTLTASLGMVKSQIHKQKQQQIHRRNSGNQMANIREYLAKQSEQNQIAILMARERIEQTRAKCHSLEETLKSEMKRNTSENSKSSGTTEEPSARSRVLSSDNGNETASGSKRVLKRPPAIALDDEDVKTPVLIRSSASPKLKNTRERADLAYSGRKLVQRSISALSEGDETTNKPISWKQGQYIGQGSFSRVFTALNDETGELLAVKYLKMEQMKNSSDTISTGTATSTKGTLRSSSENDDGNSGVTLGGRFKKLEREIRIMQKCKHPNIVRYLGTDVLMEPVVQFCILMEYVPGGTIASIVRDFGALSEKNIKNYASQILEGLKYLHGLNIIHRDVKGANILVTDSGVVKLADFGCSTSFEGTDSVTEAAKRKQLGTFRFMAPEAIRYATEHVGRKSDIWSLGCVMVEMLTGEKPWPNMSHPGPLMFKVGAEGQRPPLKEDTYLSPACSDFLDCCFFVNPDERWSAQDLRMHKFLCAPRSPLLSASANSVPRNEPAVLENQILVTQSLVAPRSSYVVSPVKVPESDTRHTQRKNRVFVTNPEGGW